MDLWLCGGCEKIDVSEFSKESYSLLKQQGSWQIRQSIAWILLEEMHLRTPTIPHIKAGLRLPRTYWRLIFDDSTRQDNAWAAAVGRNSQSRVKLATGAWVATSDPEHAEANTILLGLKLAADMRDTSCITISDAESLIHRICNKDSMNSWRVFHVIYECRSLLQANTRARLKFNSRLTNEAAHCASRLYLNHQLLGQWLYESLPTPLLEKLDINSCN